MVKIYYITGTGNSLIIARDIGAELGTHELISIPHLQKMNENTIIDAEVVGFVFPVHFGRPPVIIQEFIKRIEIKNCSYLFAVANGGGLFGRSLNIFKRLLKRKGKELNAGFQIGMPGTHPHVAHIHRKTCEEHFRQESIAVENISKIIKSRSFFITKNHWGVLVSIYSLFAFDIPYDLSKRHQTDTQFWMNDGCRNCGLCIKICPVDNLVQSKWKPKWQHNCISCLACYHVCPWRGIQLRCEWRFFDLIPYEILDFRYRHPEITIDELINQ